MNAPRIALAALAALSVLGAACSDDDDGEATATSPAPPAAASTSAAATTGPAATAAGGAGTTTPTASVAPATTGPVASGPAAPASSSPSAAPTTAPPAAEPAVAPTEIAEVDMPTDLAWREGDPGLYVTEQGGRVMRVGDGEPTVALDMTDLTEGGGERGLLGLAFAPGGDVAYVNYTDNDGNTVIAEHPVDAAGTFLTGDNSRTVLQIEQPYPNHNGGDLNFGPDGLLYIGMGDGGSAGDPQRRASDLTSLLGKILRIDPAIGNGQPYTVPADNPFVGTDAAPEIWAYGLRNPWRFSFDRETGDLWIADVGQSSFEEVDVAPAEEGFDAGRGLNFGWSAFEGNAPYNDDVTVEQHTPPVYTYTRADGCSISGGVRARGDGAGSLSGWYVFGDYCANTVWALEVLAGPEGFAAGRRVTLSTEVAAPTAVVDGPDGTVYALSHAGPVYRLDA
jgi:glucose/arabinose dehydrogenase